MSWFLLVLMRYADFSGRSGRKEYWYFWLFVTVIFIVLTLIDVTLHTWSRDAEMGLFGGIFVLFLLIPTIAVTTRRLHDIEKSGWWQLLNLLPFIGPLVMLAWLIRKGTPGDNLYGPDPIDQHDAASN